MNVSRRSVSGKLEVLIAAMIDADQSNTWAALPGLWAWERIGASYAASFQNRQRVAALRNFFSSSPNATIGRTA
jgi:hypothetical protein